MKILTNAKAVIKEVIDSPCCGKEEKNKIQNPTDLHNMYYIKKIKIEIVVARNHFSVIISFDCRNTQVVEGARLESE